MSIIEELSKASPTTLAEGLYFIILSSIGTIILLRPEDFLIISGITIPPILQQPDWLGLLMILGSPSILLLTQFGIWVKNERE